MREARRRAGLSQAELAARAGTTQSAIARLERGGGHPSLERISQLVEACGFEVRIHLVPTDDDGWQQVRANAARSPEERIARSLGAVRLAEGVRDAGARARSTRRHR